MNKFFYLIFSLALVFGMTSETFAGNPDRQGEAGAYELLMNPWARSAGLGLMNTSFISGVESMRLNVAGLSRINKMELNIAHTRYLVGTDVNMNALGFATKMGKSGSLGISLMAVDFGDNLVTTEALPDGTGATFSPNFFNIGIGYSHMFENKISVGFLLRVVSESTADVSASGMAVDAGVQYVTGPQDNFKFGISLRNIGSPIAYEGDGLGRLVNFDNEGNPYTLTLEQRSAQFELPSVLNVGLSYDFIFGTKTRLTAVGNFTSNSFGLDNVGGGLEFGFMEMFMLRAGYKYEMGSAVNAEDLGKSAYTGVSAGLSLQVPVKKDSETKVGLDYAYRTSMPFDGTHNIGIRVTL